MLPPFDKLRRILVLEKRMGYTDRAVIGGLAQFAALWDKEARQTTEDSFLLRLIGETVALLNGYSDEGVERRQAIVREILREWGPKRLPPRLPRRNPRRRRNQRKQKPGWASTRR